MYQVCSEALPDNAFKISKKDCSLMTAALMISAKPERKSLLSSVFSMEISQITNSGWLNTPIIFLYPLKLTPFLPPTLASTCDKRVVETKPYLSPLI